MKTKKEEIRGMSRVRVKKELMHEIDKILFTPLMDIEGDDLDKYISKKCGYERIGLGLKMAKEIFSNYGYGIVRAYDNHTVSVEFKKGGIWWSMKRKDVEIYHPGAF